MSFPSYDDTTNIISVETTTPTPTTMPMSTQLYNKPIKAFTTMLVESIDNPLKLPQMMTATTSSPSLSQSQAQSQTTTSTISSISSPYHRDHLEHQKITFEIPSHRDLQHIDTLHNFNTLLKRIGNVMTYETSHSNDNGHLYPTTLSMATLDDLHPQKHQLITNAEISNSVVLDLADLKSKTENDFNLERFFAGADMHSIINYLWIGVVASLVILSVIFIVFSCYFYRKFREWKKCNKDMRAHLNGTNNLCAHANEALTTSTSSTTTRTATGNVETQFGATTYYRVESPPCYTIATGLPTYDEALLHHHQHQQEHYLNYAYKYTYPTLAAMQQHQHPYQHGTMEMGNVSVAIAAAPTAANSIVNDDAIATFDGHFIRNWRKSDKGNTAHPEQADYADYTLTRYCNTQKLNLQEYQEQQQRQQHQQPQLQNQQQKQIQMKNQEQKREREQEKRKQIKMSSLQSPPSPPSSPSLSPSPSPPAYDIAASAALLSSCDEDATGFMTPKIRTSTAATTLTLSAMNDEIIDICSNASKSLNDFESSEAMTYNCHFAPLTADANDQISFIDADNIEQHSENEHFLSEVFVA